MSQTNSLNADLPLYVNTKQTETIFGITLAKQAKLRSGGLGPAYIRQGNQILYATKDLIEWLDSHKIQSTADLSPAMRAGRYKHLVQLKPKVAKRTSS